MSSATLRHRITTTFPIGGWVSEVEPTLSFSLKFFLTLISQNTTTMKGWMYILKYSNDSYYTGSTKNLELRLKQHMEGEGANHTKKRLPVLLVYYEEFDRIDLAFYREKQIQGWTRKKKEVLINGWVKELKKAAECMNETHCKNWKGS